MNKFSPRQPLISRLLPQLSRYSLTATGLTAKFSYIVDADIRPIGESELARGLLITQQMRVCCYF